MIPCGKDRNLQSTAVLPVVQEAVMMLLQNVKMGIIQKQQIDGYTQETPVWKTTMASVQPMKESLAVRKEGERSWRWHVIHTLADIELKTDDIVVLFGIRYRIMEKTNWAQHGYIQYDAIEDYAPEAQ